MFNYDYTDKFSIQFFLVEQLCLVKYFRAKHDHYHILMPPLVKYADQDADHQVGVLFISSSVNLVL